MGCAFPVILLKLRCVYAGAGPIVSFFKKSFRTLARRANLSVMSISKNFKGIR